MAVTERIAVLVEAAGFDGVGQGFRDMGDQSVAAGDRIKGAMKVAGAAAGGLLAAGLTTSFAAALDLGVAQAKLQAQLGLSSKEAARVGSVAGKIYADNWGESADEVGVALRAVTLNISGMSKASSADLQKITEKVFAVASAFDEDLGKVTVGVGQLMKTGLAKDATEALDIITVGFQQGVDKSQDFLDTLNEYSVEFQALGLSGAQATGLLSQGLKAGARDADTVADAIKEFAIRAVDGSISTKNAFTSLGLDADKTTQAFAAGGKSASDAFQLVLTRINAIQNPVLKNTIAVALLGTKTEDLKASLFALDPSKAVAGLGQLKGAADKVAAALGSSAKNQFDTFVRTLQTGFIGVMPKVLPLLHDLGTVIGSVVLPVMGVAAVAIGKIADTLASVPAPALLTIAAITGVAVAWRALGLTALIGGAAGRIAGAWRMAIAGATTFGGQLRGLGSAAAGGLGSLIGKITIAGAAMVGLGAGLAIYGIAQAQAAKRTAEHKAAVEGLAGALKESKGALDDNVTALAAKAVIEAGGGKISRQLGIGVDVLTQAYLGNKDATAQVAAALKDYVDVGGHGQVATAELMQSVSDLLGVYPDAVQTAKDMATAQAGANKAAGDGAEATDRAATSAGKFSAAQDKITTSAEDAKTELQKLLTLIDEANGVQIDAITASSNYQAVLDDLTQSFKDNGTSLDDHDAKGRANIKVALDMMQAAKDVAKAKVEETGSTKDATKVFADAKKAYIDTAVKMGVTKAAAVALANKIFAIPTEYSLDAKVPHAGKVQTELEGIYDKVKNIPAGKSVTIKAPTKDAEKNLIDLGYKVKHLPGGKVTITAPTDDAALKLSRFILRARMERINIPIISYVRDAAGGGPAVHVVVSGHAAGGPVFGPGSDTSDNLLVPLSPDEFVVRAAMSRKHRALLWDINSDRLDKVGIAGQKMSVRGMATGGVFNPEGPIVTTHWDLNALARGISIISKSWKDITPHAVVGAAGNYTGGGALGEWIARAIAFAGVPADWARPLRALVMHESGGNPNAINNYDINAQRGDPSRGLAQTIMSTFQSFRDPRLPDNIYDPISNLVAALNYIRGHYGDIRHIASYRNDDLFVGGYADGGTVPRDGFGLLHKGERVQTQAQQRAGGIDYDQLAAAVVRAIRAAGLQIVIDGRVAGRLSGAAVTRLGR